MIPALLLVADGRLWYRLLFTFDLLAMRVALVMLVFALVVFIVLVIVTLSLLAVLI